MLLLGAVSFGLPAAAQGKPQPPAAQSGGESSDVTDIIAAGLAGTEQPGDPSMKAGQSAAEKELWDAYYATAKYSYVNRRDAFAWQSVTTKIIFVLVIVLVLFGATLTALQFTRTSTGVTALKASTGGIEVTSPVIGVVILTLSLGFFYLYLANVYPINEVKAGSVESRPAKT